VATVDGQGKITCLRGGTVTVTVTNTNNVATTTSTISVTCVPPPPPLDIAVTPPQVPFNHTVGTTSCPQKIGSLHITSNQQVSVSVVPANSAITVASPTLTVPAAGAADVDVFFNCTVTASFTTTIAVTATNAAGGTATRTITVTATIAR
jgi:hypothetical protein